MAINQFPAPDTGGIPSGNTASRPAAPAIGDTYYNGELEILEIYNGTSWVAVSAPPSSPSIASVTDASTGDAYTSTAGKLAVVFTPGSGGGTPSQYNAYTTTNGHTATSSTTTVNITGLTPGTAYTVYGNAQNNFGTTINTANSNAVTPSTLPEVRTIGTATASTSASEVTVTWTNGNNGGKNLSAITITPFLNGTTAETSRTAATTSSTSYTFTSGQLTEGSAYTFKVKATNANGTCADSTASNSATMPGFISIDFLVVAGGGGGGSCGGGGGAGGLRSSVTATGGSGSLESNLSTLKNTNYTVTVGGGGAAGTAGQAGVQGVSSVFSSVTSIGGGFGQGNAEGGGNGGSGGGSGSSGLAGNGGSGNANQGYNGGNGSPSASFYPAGGGGGAAAVGANASGGSTGGNGGIGRATSITGSSVVRAGSGGGGLQGGGTAGTGGDGGGGNGRNSNTPAGEAGQNNSGGGGGGGGFSGGSYGNGGAGGSGVVILRWLTSAGSITVGAGLTADATGTDGSHSYKRFTAGSGNVSFA